MCPDKKLKWFKDHGRTTAQIKQIKTLSIKRWDESYKPMDEAMPTSTTAASKVANCASPTHHYLPKFTAPYI
jgi:hypothetical protein